MHDNERINDDTKMNECREMMQDFPMTGQCARSTTTYHQKLTNGDHDLEKKDDDINAAVVDALPNSQKFNAKKLMVQRRLPRIE